MAVPGRAAAGAAAAVAVRPFDAEETVARVAVSEDSDGAPVAGAMRSSFEGPLAQAAATSRSGTASFTTARPTSRSRARTSPRRARAAEVHRLARPGRALRVP